MATKESPEAASDRERRALRRVCELIPMFTLISITPSTSRHDALIDSGGTSIHTAEFKFRDDVSEYSTIPIDLAKYTYLMGQPNPMLMVCCSATTNLYVWDLTKVKPLEKTRWFKTPARYDDPSAPIERVECVMFRKSDADHVINLTDIQPIHPAQRFLDHYRDERQYFWGPLPPRLWPPDFCEPALDSTDQMDIFCNGDDSDKFAQRAIDALIASEHIGGYMRGAFLEFYRNEVVDICSLAFRNEWMGHGQDVDCAELERLMAPVIAAYNEIKERQ